MIGSPSHCACIDAQKIAEDENSNDEESDEENKAHKNNDYEDVKKDFRAK